MNPYWFIRASYKEYAAEPATCRWITYSCIVSERALARATLERELFGLGHQARLTEDLLDFPLHKKIRYNPLTFLLP